MNLNHVLTVKCSHELVDLLSARSHRSVRWDGRVSSYFWIRHGLNLLSESNQAQRRRFRVGAAEMGASKLGGPGACSPGNFWNLKSSKHTFRTFSERLTKKWMKNYAGKNAHARDLRYQMSKDWQSQAFYCFKAVPKGKTFFEIIYCLCFLSLTKQL